MATATSIFGPPSKKARAPSGLARMLASQTAPKDDGAGGESPPDESGETCTANITQQQLEELESSGTVTLDSDDGEKVVLTLDESGEGEDSQEGTAPEGM